MFFKRKIFLWMLAMLCTHLLYGQQIYYSPRPGNSSNNTSFDIIGKHYDRILIYLKKYGNRAIISYDKRMQPVDTLALDSLPYDVKDVHFIDLQAGFILLYQYEHKGNVICKAVLFDGYGNRKKPAIRIDKTVHPLKIVGGPAYSHILSEDKSKLLVFKMEQKRNSNRRSLKTFLLDSSLNLLHQGETYLPKTADNFRPSQITLSNKGGLYLLFNQESPTFRNYLTSLSLLYKPPFDNRLILKNLHFKSFQPGPSVLLTIDERGKRLWLNAFDFDQKHRHFAGVSTWQFGMDSLATLNFVRQPFKQETRIVFADKKRKRKSVFDHYVPQQLFFSLSGSALLIAEKKSIDAHHQSLYGDIGLFHLDEKGNLHQVQKIGKGLTPYTSDSYLIVNRGKALHFLINEAHGATRFLSNYIFLLRDYRYSSNNSLSPLPVMEKMDKGYHWLPALGKQISNKEVIIPCKNGNNFFFGLIHYK